MLVCMVGYGGKRTNGRYMVEKEYLVPPSIAEDFDIKVGTKVVIPYKQDGYTVGDVLDVQEKDIFFKDAMNKPRVIDVVDFSTNNNFEKIRFEYKLFQDIADAVKRYKDYSDYGCEISVENHYDLGSCEQSITLHFSSPLDPTCIFLDTFNQKSPNFDEEDEEDE